MPLTVALTSFLHWNQWEDLCITHQSHDLRAYLSLHYRHLGAAQVFWSAFQYNGREIGVFQTHLALVDDQHGHGLGHGIDLLLLFCLLLFSSFTQEI